MFKLAAGAFGVARWGLCYIISIPDSSCAGTKTIPDKASVHTLKNGDFGAISVTARRSAAPTFNMLRHISDRFFATIGVVWTAIRTVPEVNK